MRLLERLRTALRDLADPGVPLEDQCDVPGCQKRAVVFSSSIRPGGPKAQMCIGHPPPCFASGEPCSVCGASGWPDILHLYCYPE